MWLGYSWFCLDGVILKFVLAAKLPFAISHVPKGFPSGSVVKNLPANAGSPAEDAGSILGSGRSPGEGNGNPLQDPCLENPVDRGAWRAPVHGVAKEFHFHFHVPKSFSPLFVCLFFPASQLAGFYFPS